MKLAIIMPAEYEISAFKISCGSQQHTLPDKNSKEAQQQSRILLNGNSIKTYFIKLLINVENQTYIYLYLEFNRKVKRYVLTSRTRESSLLAGVMNIATRCCLLVL